MDHELTLGVGEENTPGVTNPLVELDGTLSGLSLEVGGDGTKTETVYISSIRVPSQLHDISSLTRPL
jgi:hypothetical protein